MRLLVAGSRNFTDRDFMYLTLRNTIEGHYLGYVPEPDKITIVHGGAHGADMMAHDFARINDYRSEIHIANWPKYGKSAGYIRNKEMVDAGADWCCIFYGPEGETAGTRSTHTLAEKAGIKLGVYYEKTQD